MPDNLAALVISDAAEQIRTRQLSPVELTASVLDRVEAMNPHLNAYILVSAERALADARVAADAIAAGSYRGPLHGVPLGVKDLYDVEGLPTTAGSKFYGAGRAAVQDAPSIARLKEAGAVIVGKLNMHEFAFGADSLNPHFGYCRNPWDLDRIAGGSSGGSGVAVAADLCLGATGSDTGGSIRIPASVCGIVGFKPTRGLVSTRGLVPMSWTMDHAGPMTKTVRDAALMLNAMAGFDPADPASIERPPQDFAGRLEGGLKGVRVGIPTGHFFEETEHAVESAVMAAAEELRRLGATVSQVTLDMNAVESFQPAQQSRQDVPALRGSRGLFLAIACVESYAFHRELLAQHREDYGASVLQPIELLADLPAADYASAQRARDVLTVAFEQTLTDEVDVLLAPTTRRTAPTIEEALKGDTGLAWNTLIFDLTSQPSISVPCGFDEKGLPIGLMLSGLKWSDALVLQVAHAYEQATDWHTRKPDLSVVDATPG